jgi:class 3 adenylate cyclase/tetratricopeptide (TPR) repeat protein
MPSICSSCSHWNSATARYCEQCGVQLVSAMRRPENRERAVELRQGTFLFCDIVQSTQLARHLELDDFRAVLKSFRRSVADVVRKHHGHLNSFFGDGAFASFGYPEAREDAAELAIRTGLELVTEVRNLTPVANVALNLRVGINSGTVVMGELIDEAEIPEESMIGSAVYLASRLQSEAPHGCVVIAEATRRLAGRFFDYQDLGLLKLKGFDDGVHVWQVVGISAIASRFDARHDTDSITHLVGRSEVLRELGEMWRRALKGEGQCVVVQGEAGIGKSRLGRAQRDTAVQDGGYVLELDCTPRTDNAPLYPVIVVLRRVIGLESSDDVATSLIKLADWLGELLGNERKEEAMGYLAPLLNLDVSTRSTESAERIRERTIDLLAEIVRAVATKQAVFVLCEDAHWADATTVSLIKQVQSSIGSLPIFVMLTMRSELVTNRVAFGDATQISLEALDPTSAAVVVRQFAGRVPISDDLVDRIVRRAEGNPLFLEEMTRSVVEARNDRNEALIDSVATTDVPITLQALLQARLDRWAAVKPIVQAASVIGREFSLAMLEHVLEDRQNVPNAIARLIDHGLVAPIANKSSGYFRFSHALIQDAVYQTMLRSDRQRLHSSAADTLAQLFPGQPEAGSDILAHHLALAHRYLEAVKKFVDASSNTSARAAYLESIGHCRSGLKLIGHIEPDAVRRQLHRLLLTQLGVALAATVGYAAPEVEQTYEQARALCDGDDDPEVLFPIVRGLGTFYFVRCDLTNADRIARQCLEIAKRTQRPDHLIEATSFHGYTSLYLGRVAESRAVLEECVSLYHQHQGARFRYPSAQDAGTAAWSLLGITAWLQGDSKRAEQCVNQVLLHADQLGRSFDQAYAHVWIAMLRNMQRRFDEAEQHAAKCTEISSRDGFNTWLAAATMHGCISTSSRTSSPESIGVLRHVLGAFMLAGAEANAPFFLWGIARGEILANQIEEARKAVDEAKTRANGTGEMYLQSELLMLEAELDPDPDRGQMLLRQAMALAEDQGAVVLALHAALKLLKHGPDPSERLQLAGLALEGKSEYPEHSDWIPAALLEAKSVLSNRDHVT